MKQIISIIHYIPDGWKGKAFTTEVSEARGTVVLPTPLSSLLFLLSIFFL